jgi:pimeloyl-ACP methyl ester carboxylesterase
VIALLDAAGLPAAHIVGHDWGGFQAWALGHRHPDRVSSITVLSTPHPAAMA